MQIQHQQHSHSGIFLIESEGVKIAELTYRYQNETHIIADHTWVDDSLRGQGIAHLLLDQLVAFAREKQLKIIAHCSYIEVMFRRKKDFADVVA